MAKKSATGRSLGLQPPPGRVLVVDDDTDIRALVAGALLDEGYEVTTAPDGLAALERVRDYVPDVILLDMNMPRMNGWEFADAYRARPGPHAPIIVFTAGSSAVTCAREVRAADALGKPFDLDDLSALVRHYTAPGASPAA
jgi:two-component system response regulator MprA